MVLPKIHKYLSRAQIEGLPRPKFIAFYKGDPVPDAVLALAIELATFGYTTEQGRGLRLIPIRIYDRAQKKANAAVAEENRRRPEGKKICDTTASPSIKNRDCVPLTSFLPTSRNRLKVSYSEMYVSSLLFSGASDELTVTPVPYMGAGNKHVKRNSSCLYCRGSLAVKRLGARYCSNACRTNWHRHGAQA